MPGPFSSIVTPVDRKTERAIVTTARLCQRLWESLSASVVGNVVMIFGAAIAGLIGFSVNRAYRACRGVCLQFVFQALLNI